MSTLLRRPAAPGKADLILVWATCALYLSLTVIFYKQRIAFSDTAVYVSHIIARDKFEIAMGSRFVGGLTQVLLYAGMHTGLSLKALMILYSLNFALIPVACVLLSVRWFKEVRTAWSILMFYTLMAFYMFYYPVSEYQTGLGIFLFYIGMYQYYRFGGIPAALFILLSLLFIPTVIFCHPLGALVFLCWLVFRVCCQPEEWCPLVLILLAGIVSVLIKNIYFLVPYEEQRGNTVQNFLQFSVSDLSGSLGAGFLRFLVQDYFLLIILPVCVVVALIAKRKKTASLIFVLTLAGWWVLVTVSFKDAHYEHYYEHMYQAIPFFAALGFTTFVFPLLAPFAQRVSIILIMTISFAKILSGHGWLDERYAWMQRCFHKMEELYCKKAILTPDLVPGGWHCLSEWSLPYESLLISSLEDSRKSKVILLKASIEDALKTENAIIDVDPYPYMPQLNRQYFHIAGERYCIPRTVLDPITVDYIRTGKQVQ